MSPNTTFQQLQHPNDPWERGKNFRLLVWTAGVMNSILMVLNGLAMFVPCPTASERDAIARVVADLCGFAVRVAPFALAVSGVGLFLAVLARALTDAHLPISGVGGYLCVALSLASCGVLGVSFVVQAGVAVACYLFIINPGLAIIVAIVAVLALIDSAS